MIENTEKREIVIPYIKKNGSEAERVLRVYIPKDIAFPAPAVFYAHYELAEESKQLALFLKRGWIVGMCVATPDCNRTLVDDDLYFNNAAFVFFRNMDCVDGGRVAVYGGSAGGYMAMMLSILHLGICCTVSFSGIFNQYFNTCCYMRSVHGLNMLQYEKLNEDEKKNHDILAKSLPMPLQFDLQKWFAWFEPDNQKDYVTLSPCKYVSCFSAPILFAHYTSDNLVPIDQVTHRYAYQSAGASLPAGIKYRLELCALPDGCDKSLEELIPKEQLAYHLVYITGDQPDRSVIVPYSPDRKYNISVFDDGPVEAFGQHMKYEHGVTDLTGYLHACFTSGEKEHITKDKLNMLIRIYRGDDPILKAPMKNGNAYGSLKSVRTTVIEELKAYSSICDDLVETANGLCDDFPESKDVVAEILHQVRTAG